MMDLFLGGLKNELDSDWIGKRTEDMTFVCSLKFIWLGSWHATHNPVFSQEQSGIHVIPYEPKLCTCTILSIP